MESVVKERSPDVEIRMFSNCTIMQFSKACSICFEKNQLRITGNFLLLYFLCIG